MKKLFTFSICTFLTLTSMAQVAPNKSEALVVKCTATWCGPCGSWGWDLQEEIMAEDSASSLITACYGSNTSSFYNQTADELTVWAQSYPNWGVNNINRTAFSSTGGIYSTTTKNTIKNAVDSFAATSPAASTGYTVSLTGNTYSVNTKTKFWQAGSGEYYLAAYMIEDGVLGTQNGQSGTVAHHNVMRGSMTNPFGDLLASGSITANQTYNKTFSFTVTDATWVKNNIKIAVVLWKKNGSSYNFVNSNSKKDLTPNDISNVEAISDLKLFPNPARNYTRVKGFLNGPSGVTISIVNSVGQTIQKNIYHYTSNDFNELIALENLTNGVYFLQVSTDEGARSVQKLIVNR